MDTLENYTYNLCTYLQEKLGERFKGSYYVNNGIGFIRGCIDDKMIDLRCYDSIVCYEFDNHNDIIFRYKLDAIIEEYIGVDEIVYIAECHSWANNSLGSIFMLNYQIDENKKIK